MWLSVLLWGPIASGAPVDEAPDESWIEVTGRVEEPHAHGFTLHHAAGEIRVEVDDWDLHGDAHGLLPGDAVVVRGRIDADLFEERTIEASSVYVEGSGRTVLASATDEEDLERWWLTGLPLLGRQSTFEGEVTAVLAEEGRFRLRTDAGLLRVESGAASELSPGDMVRVTGGFDADPLSGRVLDARRVVPIAPR